MTLLEVQANAIVRRFCLAVETLQQQGIGIKGMCKKMHIDRRNLYHKLAMRDTTTVMPPLWLAQMCKQYDVSADWLLTGRGEMFE